MYKKLFVNVYTYIAVASMYIYIFKQNDIQVGEQQLLTGGGGGCRKCASPSPVEGFRGLGWLCCCFLMLSLWGLRLNRLNLCLC